MFFPIVNFIGFFFSILFIHSFDISLIHALETTCLNLKYVFMLKKYNNRLIKRMITFLFKHNINKYKIIKKLKI
jgi:hypothetical protein